MESGAHLNKAPNAINALWVRLFQVLYDMFWVLIINITDSRTDPALCQGMVASFGKMTSKVYIVMFAWSALNVPITYAIAKRAQRTGTIRYPCLVALISLLYWVVAILCWFFALVAVFSTTRCEGQFMSFIVVGYLLLPVVLFCCALCCGIMFAIRGGGTKQRGSDASDDQNEKYIELRDQKQKPPV